jgi:hypothetical protein
MLLHATWEREYFNQKRRSLLGYGTMNSHATMEHVTPQNISNGNTAGNGVFYAVCADIDLMQQYRSCWIRAEATSGESNRAKSAESWVDFELGGRQSETERDWDSRPWRRRGKRTRPHCCMSLRSKAESCEIAANLRGREPGSGGTWPFLEAVIQQRGEDTADWEELVRVVVNCRMCELAIAL